MVRFKLIGSDLLSIVYATVIQLCPEDMVMRHHATGVAIKNERKRMEYWRRLVVSAASEIDSIFIHRLMMMMML